jgi:hypothetical protein
VTIGCATRSSAAEMVCRLLLRPIPVGIHLGVYQVRRWLLCVCDGARSIMAVGLPRFGSRELTVSACR